ncbi:MAG: hypothetical protein IPJ58_15620 [Ardenticatenia bacterium]|nr:hypothetical protein [Ardenticatenia bacterium]
MVILRLQGEIRTRLVGKRPAAAEHSTGERGRAPTEVQPSWDARAALLPKSGELLLHNGRGELWRSRLTVPPVSP